MRTKFHQVHIGQQGIHIDGHPLLVERDSLDINPLENTGVSFVGMRVIADHVALDSNMIQPANMESTPIHDQLAAQHGMSVE